jgi:hypothetical protein
VQFYLLLYFILFCRYYKTLTGYISGDIFEDYFRNVIFPGIEKRQSDFTLPNGTVPRARVVIDGHATRRRRELWRDANNKNIDVHIIPAHTSHLVQPLDRCVFAAMKRFFFSSFFYKSLGNWQQFTQFLPQGCLQLILVNG